MTSGEKVNFDLDNLFFMFVLTMFLSDYISDLPTSEKRDSNIVNPEGRNPNRVFYFKLRLKRKIKKNRKPGLLNNTGLQIKTDTPCKGVLFGYPKYNTNINIVPIKVARKHHQVLEGSKFENAIFYYERRADLAL